MFNSELQRMYQAWQQGNDHYIRDWYAFVEWASRFNNTSIEKTLSQLNSCRWFRKGD